jgi:hypothetical protein
MTGAPTAAGYAIRDATIITVQGMLNNSLPTNSALRPRFNDRMPSERNGAFVPRIAILRSVDQHSREDERSHRPLLGELSDFHTGDVVDQAVEIFPSYAVARRRLAWNGMAIEVVQATARR